MASVGVRFKGNSSFSIPTQKKSFKIDFDEYDEDNDDMQFLGLTGLALNNGFKDPSFLREKMFLEFVSQWVPEIRTVHTRVYVNDVYWGLYIGVEEVDKTFVQSRFGAGEDGNLFKGQASDDGGGPGGYLLVWADSDAEQGSLHADFKLGSGGEDIGLIAEDGLTIIDSLTYTSQSTDVSYGRLPDGG